MTRKVIIKNAGVVWERTGVTATPQAVTVTDSRTKPSGKSEPEEVRKEYRRLRSDNKVVINCAAQPP